MKKLAIFFVVLGFGVMATTTAKADVFVGIGGGPIYGGYYAPRPVYFAPPPVFVPPAPVIMGPPIYYGRPYGYGYGIGFGYGHGHYGHGHYGHGHYGHYGHHRW